jgi:haloalkane dehalogenase
VNELLPATLLTPPTPEDLTVYQAPFPTPESRKPILVFPRNLPVDNEPATTVEILEQNEPWLAEHNVPKLLLTFEPGFLVTPKVLEWAKATIADLEVEAPLPGVHWVQEDSPAEISQALIAWFGRVADKSAE